jgi:hypothetical protein
VVKGEPDAALVTPRRICCSTGNGIGKSSSLVAATTARFFDASITRPTDGDETAHYQSGSSVGAPHVDAGAYHPETVELSRKVLDPAWADLQPDRRIVHRPAKSHDDTEDSVIFRVGALGRGRGTDLAAPAPNAHLELGPVPVGCCEANGGNRKSCMRCATPAPSSDQSRRKHLNRFGASRRIDEQRR